MRLLAILEAGRQDFLEAANSTAEEQASVKSAPDRWSVLECIEHVVTVEDRYLSWIALGTDIRPRRDPDNELRLFTRIRNRLEPIEAAEATRPQGRFRALPEALAAFETVRSRSVNLVRERGDVLYSLSVTHPYFGSISGVELLHLVDGHARRHADQIRDTVEILRTPRKSATKPATSRTAHAFTFRRDEPDIPAQLNGDAGTGQCLADSERIGIEEARLQNLQRPHLTAGTFRLDSCVLEDVQLRDGKFGSAIWKDVRFVHCDLASIRAHRLTLVRVEFIDCRLAGLTATAADWQDVLIRNGDLRYAQLPGGHFRACEFDHCNWQEADLQKADLTGCVFRSCRLTETDLRAAKLMNTDLRDSDLEALLVEMGDLRGAIVTPAEAMVLARVLGLQIR